MPRIGASRSWAVTGPPVTDRERKPGEGAGSRQLQDSWPPADVQPFRYERKRAVGELRPSASSEGTSAQPMARPNEKQSFRETVAEGGGGDPGAGEE